MLSLSARLEKILRDIWDNKNRSLLVIFTLAIGIAAVGLINNSVRMLKRDIFGQYAERVPAHVNLYVSPFPKELATAVSGMREVALAQARRELSAFVITPRGERKTLDLFASPDFTQQRIFRLNVDQGPANPGLRGILIERNSAQKLGLQVGDTLTIEMLSGNHYPVHVDGIVHDMSGPPYSLNAEVDGYVSMATLEWLGEQPTYNQINVVVADNPTDRDQVMKVAGLIRDRVIEPAGYRVGAIQVYGDPDPGDFWARRPIDGVLLVLQIMSLLAVILCGGLVVNTISAVLVQQIRQMGIMRSVGATRRQVVAIYLGYVLVLSIVALLIALPLGLLGSWGLMWVAANFLNFNISVIDLPPSIWLLQCGLGIIMPLSVALAPILGAAGLSVYEAVYQSAGGHEKKKGWLERQMVKIRLLSPPVMLSLRNTFRNKSRLGFTLATLTIAGAMFMAVFSSFDTIRGQIDEFGRYIAFDASLNIPGGANKYTVEREALRIPDVRVAEAWASTNIVLVHSDGSESDRIELVGLPPNSQTIQPRLVQGRWLLPGDTWQVVLNEDLLAQEPAIQVGQRVTAKINGLERSLEVVGVVSKHMSGSRIYMDYDQLTRLTGQHNQVDTVRVLATPGVFSPPAEQRAINQRLEKRFEDAQISDAAGRTRFEIFDAMSGAFNILLVILLLVAIILAVIGGLGLTGAMGLNVLERTREIGVLRAVGASHASVRMVVVVEGAVVALLSWVLSALLSYPVGMVLCEAVVSMAFGASAPFRYSVWGLFAWLAAVLLIGVLASLAPARQAVRLTVREVLNYE